jgi:hypothetical protein
MDIADTSSISTDTTIYWTGGDAVRVVVDGNYAYVTTRTVSSADLRIVYVGDRSALREIATYPISIYGGGIAVSGNVALVAGGDSLRSIDVVDPQNPKHLGSAQYGTQLDLKIEGDVAYGVGLGTFWVFDISDDTPVFVSGLSVGGYRLALAGDYAFVMGGMTNDVLSVIDISDPASPALLDSRSVGGASHGLAVSGDNLFIPTDTGLKVLEIFQRQLKLENNIGQSLTVNGSSDAINAARITTTQSGSVDWELTADGGSSWQSATPDGSWIEFANPGSDLRWRSTLDYAGNGINSTVNSVQIEWLSPTPTIESVGDIGNDQGRQVRLGWLASGHDFASSSTQITSYAIFRRIDLLLAPEAESGRPVTENDRPDLTSNGPELVFPPGDWDYVTSVPAFGELEYNTVVPTLKDSTISEGMYYTTFLVRAATAAPTTYFDSEPDSGYSVDNLAPGAPMMFAAAYNQPGGTQLSWVSPEDEDFQYHRIYRSATEDFTPGAGNLAHTTSSTEWLDTIENGQSYFYKISSVDFSGNESEPSAPDPVTAISDSPVTPEGFDLHQNVPNPFNPATAIRYDVPAGGGHVSLRVYDVAGRLVCTLVDGDQTPGVKNVLWNGSDSRGTGVASGVYFYRLTAPGYEQTRKMLLMK